MRVRKTSSNRIVYLTTLACACLCRPSAADYQIKPVRVLPMDSYPARVTIEQVTIAADPYPTDDKSFTVFDIKGLNSRGYFPVQVIIQNSSLDRLALRTRDIVLVSGTGQQLYTTPATLVVQDALKGGMFRMVSKVRSKKDATSIKKGSPLLDFTDKELTNRDIEPGSVATGFLFFYTPEPKKGFFTGGSLRIPHLTNERTQKILGPFVIALDPALASSPAR